MFDGIDAFEHASLFQVQVRALTEEESSREECAAGHDDHAPTLSGSAVNHTLYGFGLQQGAVSLHTIVGDDVLPAERRHINAGGIAEPCVDGGTVRPLVRR